MLFWNPTFLLDSLIFYNFEESNSIISFMKTAFKLSLRPIYGVLFLWLFSLNLMAEVNPKPFVVPELTSWEGEEGHFQGSGRLVVKGSNKELLRIAQDFAEEYYQMSGTRLTVTKGKAKKGDFVFSLKKQPQLNAEGYVLNVGDQLELCAASAKGVFWGTRTLLQLAEQQGNLTFPKGRAVDMPEYALRGFMLDCGRKYIPMDYLRSLVKMMAYYKMNTLQIHLNDNGFVSFFGNDWEKTQAAFRLESTTYPGLTAKDGAYSKKEFIELQILAEQHQVEIIPEIDVPAHSLAFTHYKPEIGSKEYGMDHLDLFNPETYAFVDGLFKEYLEGEEPVFRGKRVHIGTDEYSNAKKEVVEKFREFTDHYIRYVESFGKQAMCWGALTHAKGDTPVKSEDVIMNCWYNGYAQPRDMKKQGYQLVSIPDGLVYIVPAAGYYYDYLNCEHLYNNWTPAVIGNVKFEENDPSILGGMFAVWNDHVGNGISVKDIHHRLFPALQTMAVKCWTGKHTVVPYKQFDLLRKQLSEAPGVNEMATYGYGQQLLFALEEVKPETNMPYKEIGYDYSVNFMVEGQNEVKGTELFRSSNAVFYLSDPRTGRLGFARDGYLNTFKYRLPKGKKVEISVRGNAKQTALYVDHKCVEVLRPLTVYNCVESDKINFQYGETDTFRPEMYIPSKKMYYQRTLVFPLEKSGKFNSKITDLKVYNYWLKD